MWSEVGHDDERLPRKRGPPRSHPSDGYHKVPNIVPRQPPLLGRKPSLLKKPELLGRPGEGSYNRYYSLAGYQDYDKGSTFSYDQRSVPPQKPDESDYQCSRYNRSATHQIYYKDMRDGFRRKRFYSSRCMRDQFPHIRNPTFFRESSVCQNFSLHNRFVSSNSNYTPIQSKMSFLQECHHKSKQQNEIFGKVEKKLIGKGLFLDKSIQFALGRDSAETGVQCVEEQLKLSISEYDKSTQDFSRYDMWSEGQYDCERLSRDQLPPQSHPSDGYHRVLNTMPRKIPLLGRKAPLLEKKPTFLERPGKGSYNKYHRLDGYQEYDKGSTFSYDRRSVPLQKGDESNFRWSRYYHSASHQSYYRSKRYSHRRKSFYSSHYMKDQPPHTKDATFFGESLLDRKDSPISSRRHSTVQGKTYCFQQSQHKNNEKKVQSLKTSRYTLHSSSKAAPSSKVLDKPRRLTEKELEEAVRLWVAKNSKISEESELSGISEFKVLPTTPFFSKQPEATVRDAVHSTEACEDTQQSSHFKPIALKAKEIKQAYKKCSEIFAMVVKMLIQKDPSLEKSIQFALRQNLQEIGEWCVRELEDFIAEYASQDFRES